MLLSGLDAVHCRFCGGTHAPPHDNDYGLCATCWFKYCQHGGSEYGMVSITETLISRVLLTASRLKSTKGVARCQALSQCRHTKSPYGYQCGNLGTLDREGFKVCAAHKRATDPVYISDAPKTGHDRFIEMLSHIVSLDPSLLSALQSVIEQNKKRT